MSSIDDPRWQTFVRVAGELVDDDARPRLPLATWVLELEELHGVDWDRKLDLVWEEDERRGYRDGIPSIFK